MIRKTVANVNEFNDLNLGRNTTNCNYFVSLRYSLFFFCFFACDIKGRVTCDIKGKSFSDLYSKKKVQRVRVPFHGFH